MLNHSTPKHHRQEVSVDALIDQAGKATKRPPKPPGGIPRQWVPGWIRWPIRVLYIPLMLLDLWAQKVARWIMRPPFLQVGKCKRRGNCCHYVLIPAPHGPVTWLHYWWSREINGFFPRQKEEIEYEGEKMMIMGCRYLQKNGSCKHHNLRPMICRQWPLIEYFARPQILKGCGYHFVPRNAEPLTKDANSKLKLINEEDDR
jgi:hypothetical protein